MKRNKLFSRAIAFVLAFAMCVGMIPATAFAADVDTAVSNNYYTVISNKQYALAPGATESEIVVNNATGDDRKVVHVFEVDTKNEFIEVLPGYYGIDQLNPDNLAGDGPSGTNVWTDKELTKTVQYYENTLGYNVVGAMNTALAYDSDAPYGYMVYNGVVLGTPEVHKGAQTYLAIDGEGNCELRSMSTPLDGTEVTAISANFGWLVKDGKLSKTSVERTSSDASRSMIGIKADGTLVFCQVDGRNAPVSTGLSDYEMGEMMLSLGCVNAVNCDGGGSSTFVSKREGETVNTMRSIPSDGSERPTINSVIIVSNAKATGEFDHAILDSDYDYYAPGTSATIKATGVDSAGSPATLPTEGITWELSDSSYGSIENGVFTSNGTKGDVNVKMIYNTEVVGEKTLHIVDPATFALALDETVLPYGKSMSIDFACTYGSDNWEVCVDGAYTLELSDANAATLVGNTLTSTSDESFAGVNVTATYIPNPTLTDTLKVSFGKGSEILFDFEDGDISNFLGVDEMYDWAEKTGATAPIQSNGNYSEDGDSETFLATIENGGQVRKGEKALGVTLDYTDAQFAAWSYNMFFYTGEPVVLRDVANGNNATTLGMWVYIPEGAPGMAMQLTAYAGSSAETAAGTQYHFMFNTVSGVKKNLNSCTEADIPESRWVYATIDISGSNYVSFVDPYGTKYGREPSFIRFYVKPTTAANLDFYFDDFTLDYSSAVEDRVLPTITNITYATEDTGITLENGAEINGSTMAFTANIADDKALDTLSGKILVDGVELDNVNVSNKNITSENVTLMPGEHTVTFEVCDKLGNKAKVTRTFTVAGDAKITLAGHNDSGTKPEYDSVYYVDINVADVSTVEKLTTTLKLQTANTWEIEGATVATGFDATFDYNEVSRLLTVTLEKNGQAIETSNQTLASIPVRVWSWNGANHVTDEPIKPETQFATGYCPIVSIECEVVKGEVEFKDNIVNTFGGSISVETNLNDNVNPWHYHDEELTTLNKEVTCTENGYANRTYCETCKSVIDWGESTAAEGHNYELVGDKFICSKENCESVYASGTGMFQMNGNWYYSISDTVVSGWHNVDNVWHYFRSATKIAAVGSVTCQIGSHFVTYEFNEDGSLKYNPWVETEDGLMHFYGPSYYNHEWATIDDAKYYFGSDGCAYVGYHIIKDSRYSHDDDYRVYKFADDGKLEETLTSSGLLATEDGVFYLKEGYAQHAGLVYVDGEYYYFNSSRKAVTGSYYVENTNNLLPAGTYEFAADGKMNKESLNGIVGDYYYIDAVLQKGGLTKVGDDYYYFSTTNGKMSRNVTKAIYYTCCDLPIGTYTFGADGKVVIEEKNGIVGDYYYVDGVIQQGGLTKVGDDYYYFSTTNGKMSRNVTKAIYYTCCDLPIGTYTFGADGKVVIEEKNGIVGDYYYIDGVIQQGGLTKVGDDYYYFSTTNGKMSRNVTKAIYYTCCDLPIGTYTFGEDGKVVIEVKNGIIGDYYYIDGVIQQGGLTKVGDDYYYFSTTNGKMSRNVTKAIYYTCCDLPIGTYTFGEDGKVVIEVKNGIIGDYYYIDGVIQQGGLTKVGDDYYYFSTTNGKMSRNVTKAIYYTCCDLPIGTYTFGADGKVVIEDKDGIVGDYYYIDGVIQQGGLTKVGDDYYYFSTTNGKMSRNVTKAIYYTCCDLPIGTYTFGADGKVVF